MVGLFPLMHSTLALRCVAVLVQPSGWYVAFVMSLPWRGVHPPKVLWLVIMREGRVDLLIFLVYLSCFLLRLNIHHVDLLCKLIVPVCL